MGGLNSSPHSSFLNENDETVVYRPPKRRYQPKPKIPNQTLYGRCTWCLSLIALFILFLVIAFHGRNFFGMSSRSGPVISENQLSPVFNENIDSGGGFGNDLDTTISKTQNENTNFESDYFDEEMSEENNLGVQNKNEKEQISGNAKSDLEVNLKSEKRENREKDIKVELREDSKFEYGSRTDEMGDQDLRYRRVNFEVFEEEFD